MRTVRRQADLVLALTLLAVHAMAVWGYTGVFRGDHGRWLHEVERFALGEVPYRDFQWHFPPLALWIVGGLARFVGTDLLPVYLITSVLAALLVAVVAFYFREVRSPSDTLLLAASILLAVTYVQTSGPPLPAGAYVPAAPVGVLCLTISAVLFLRAWNSGASGGDAWWLGFFAGLAVLSKQDFWFPSALLVLASAVRFRRAAPVLMAAATVGVGASIVGLTAGFGVLAGVLTGFGHVQMVGGKGLPSWERLTVELLVAALIAGFLSTMLSIARRRVEVRLLAGSAMVAMIAAAIHVTMSMSMTAADLGQVPTATASALEFHIREGNSLFRPALGWLRERVVNDPIPLLLPALLLIAVSVRWRRLDPSRRALVALLLGFAIALRARRAFEETEWFEFLLTLPVVLLTFELLSGLVEGRELRRFRAAVGGVLLAVAVFAYHELGRGPGTRRQYPAAVIARGTVHWAPNAMSDYQRVRAVVDSLDPTGERPLLAYGYTGGWVYFTQRRNPFPITQDFVFSAFDADSLLATAPSRLILVDDPTADRATLPTLQIPWNRWERARAPSPTLTFERPRFDRLRSGCQEIVVEQSVFRVYACP